MLNKTFWTTVFLFFLFGTLTAVPPAGAQEEDANILNSFHKFRNLFGGQDMLQNTMDKVESDKDAHEGRLLGVDRETARMLKQLRNPFEPQIPKPEIIEPVEEAVPEPEPEPIIKEQLPLYQPEEKIPPPTPDAYVITGLVWNTDRPQAVVNGKIVDIGDRLDYWEVVDINKTGIELSYREQNYVVKPKGAPNVP